MSLFVLSLPTKASSNIESFKFALKSSKYSRLADETNLVGDWNYSNITFSAKAIKDEIVIPGGTINGIVSTNCSMYYFAKT